MSAAKRLPEVRGQPATAANFLDAADAELADAAPLSDNAFKIELARRLITTTLCTLAEIDA